MGTLVSRIIHGKTACLVLNGQLDDYDYIRDVVNYNKYELIIAVDGGANHLYKMGIMPNYILGDLDSIDEEIRKYYESSEVVFKKFPTKKDETDAELAVWLVEEEGLLGIDIYGALGGRIDHELANIQLLYYILERGMYPRIISENEEIYILKNDEMNLKGNIGDIVSIIPIMGDARGITLANMEYSVEELDLKYSITRGISNVMEAEEAFINVRDGCMLVVRNIKRGR
ncbi:thiamine diphosphokinase [Peptostreptococcus sp. MV1]|uniref:thiamine diphosphokinase n=1 Tax=Peptostreptococcus sp. MV1 TaxID=1219626 RepID=UPI0006895BFA|nr:thiamine diphosphokinase [Peptostreptococcus sp. MV1]